MRQVDAEILNLYDVSPGLTSADLLQFAEACAREQRVPSDVVAELIRDYAQCYAPHSVKA